MSTNLFAFYFAVGCFARKASSADFEMRSSLRLCAAVRRGRTSLPAGQEIAKWNEQDLMTADGLLAVVQKDAQHAIKEDFDRTQLTDEELAAF